MFYILLISRQIFLGPFPFYIHTHPVDEVSKNFPPKKKRSKFRHDALLRNNSIFLKPSEKSQLFSNTLISIQRSKNANRATPSEMTFKAPSENLVKGGGGGEGFPLILFPRAACRSQLPGSIKRLVKGGPQGIHDLIC